MDFSNFGDFTPDPDKVFKAMERLQDAFNEAANKPGASQPAFEKLNAAWKKLIDPSTTAASEDIKSILMSKGPAIFSYVMAMRNVQQLAQTDAAAAETLKGLLTKVSAESKDMLGGMGGIGDILGKFGGGDNTPDNTPAPKPVKRPAPKKPGKGGFKFDH